MSAHDPIAVVGRGGLFPGAADLRVFWENILGCVDAAREVPVGRWAVEQATVQGGRPLKNDQLYSSRACYLDDFDIGPAAAELALPENIHALDPLVRLVLRVGAEAWEDA